MAVRARRWYQGGNTGYQLQQRELQFVHFSATVQRSN